MTAPTPTSATEPRRLAAVGTGPRARKLPRTLPSNRSKRYQYRVATGAASPLVPADRVQDHIERLAGWGMDDQMIADAAGGIVRKTIRLHRLRRTTTIYRHYEQAILAVDHLPHPAQRRVLTIGSRRRVQALAVLKHSLASIALRIGVRPGGLARMLAQPTITPPTARKITELYDELWLTPGPSRKTGTEARKAGWHGPGAWDEDTIDDPDATPAACERRGSGAGPVAEDVAWLVDPNGGGLSITDAAERFGVTETAVNDTLARHRRRLALMHRQRISDADVEEMRRRRAANERLVDLAREYGIDKSTASLICSGKARPAERPAFEQPEERAG